MTTLIRLETLSAAARFNEEVWAKVEPFLGEEILEVGMGIGIFTEKLLGRGKVFGVEIVPEFVEEARRRLGVRPGLESLVADIGGAVLPDSLRGRTFDTIVCMNVLEHIEDDQGTLSRFLALLKPGGKLVQLRHRCLYNLDVRRPFSTLRARGLRGWRPRHSVVHRANLFGISAGVLVVPCAGRITRRPSGCSTGGAPLFWIERSGADGTVAARRGVSLERKLSICPGLQ